MDGPRKEKAAPMPTAAMSVPTTED
eukprot:COSAG05_NODE_14394_length_398_cov_0.682274_1_plen_24_part_10